MPRDPSAARGGTSDVDRDERTRRVNAVAGAATSWPASRWVRVLDRMEHRRADVGLRFWTPLWLEVTMIGPDSDRWPVIDVADQHWNWQSSEACVEAIDLAASGATDDCVLAVVSRYAVENLILNAVHEIGEWLRLDGRRLFPAHPARAPGSADRPFRDLDGNGPVHLEFALPSSPPSSSRVGSAVPDAPPGTCDRVAAAIAPSRFCYLPGTTITFGEAGPVVTGAEGPAAAWLAPWSGDVVREAAATAAGDPADRLATAVSANVHGALVHYEADRVCRAFHVDGVPMWTLASGGRRTRGAEEPVDPGQPITISVVYTYDRPGR